MRHIARRLPAALRMIAPAALLALATTGDAADWQSLSPAEVARSEGSIVVHDGGVFHFNGFDGNIDIETSIERYDLATDRWQIVATSSTSSSAPTGVTHNGLVVVDGEAWLIGGRIGDAPGKVSDRVFIFDLERYTWREGPRLPMPFASGGAALVDDRIHVFGGVDAASRCDVATHLVHDLGDPGRGWQNLTSSAAFPKARNHFATATLDGLIYAIGGQHGHDTCSKLSLQREQTKYVHVYDPVANRWQRLRDLPWAQSHTEPSTFAYANRLWMVGGRIESKRVLTYDPASDDWTYRSDLDLPMALFASGARIFHGNRLHVFGGGAANVRHPRRETWVTSVPGLTFDPSDDGRGGADAVSDSAADTTGDGAGVPSDDDGQPFVAGGVVHRVNVGGPELVDSATGRWESDTASGARHGTTGSHIWSTGVGASVSIDGVAPPPPMLFGTSRTSFDRTSGLGWRFPVTPGDYELRLYVAEMWHGAFATGVRRFDVEIEGTVRDTDVDLYARYGARDGNVLRYRVTSDANLDVRLRHVTQNPAIQGLEIVALGGDSDAVQSGDGGDAGSGGAVDNGTGGGDTGTGGGESGGDAAEGTSAGGSDTSGEGSDDAPRPAGLIVDELDIVFGPVTIGAASEWRVALTNAGEVPLTIEDVVVGGEGGFGIALGAGDTIAAGETRVVILTFEPESVGEHAAMIAIGHDGVDAVALLSLEGRGLAPVDGTVDGTLTGIWRVNVGGEAVLGSDGVPWIGDTDDSPLGYEHDASRRYATTSPVSVDGAVPGGVPGTLFASERWTSNERTGLVWRFPVRPGRHEVRLYFAEIYWGAFRAGAREFDVVLEGETMIEALDVYAEAGARNGIVRRLVVDSDATLDIALRHVTQNPALKAIEILECTAACTPYD